MYKKFTSPTRGVHGFTEFHNEHNIDSELYSKYRCVYDYNGPGAHLQIQFIIQRDENIVLDKEAKLLHHPIPVTPEDFEKSKLVYPINHIIIPENAIGYHIFGLQRCYGDKEQGLCCLNNEYASQKPESPGGIQISYMFLNKIMRLVLASYFIDGNLNTKQAQLNNIIKKINKSEDGKHIISIELTESLATFDLLLPIVPNHNRCTDNCKIS